MAAQMDGDGNLLVRFFANENTAVDPPRVEEYVSIINPASAGDEYVAKAMSESHNDPDTNAPVTYAQRFAAQYAAFKSGKSDNLQKRREELQRQLTALEAEVSAQPTDAQIKAADKAAAKAREAEADDASVSPQARKKASEAVADVIAEAAKG